MADDAVPSNRSPGAHSLVTGKVQGNLLENGLRCRISWRFLSVTSMTWHANSLRKRTGNCFRQTGNRIRLIREPRKHARNLARSSNRTSGRVSVVISRTQSPKTIRTERQLNQKREDLQSRIASFTADHVWSCTVVLQNCYQNVGNWTSCVFPLYSKLERSSTIR